MSCLRATANDSRLVRTIASSNLTHFLVAADVGHDLKDALEQLPRERRVLGQLTVELSGQIVRSDSVLHAVIECPHP